MRTRLSVLVPLLLLLLWGWLWNQRSQAREQPAPAASPAPRVAPRVSALARLEPRDRVLHLQVPAARQQDRVARWFAEEGHKVRKGQCLVELEGARLARQEVEIARARVAQARSRLDQVAAGPKQGEVQRQRGEIERLLGERERQQQSRHDDIRRLEVEEALTRRNWERFRQLHQEGCCSAFELEQRQLAWNAAQRQLEQARHEEERIQDSLDAQLASARGELARIQEVRPTDLQAARADLQEAQAELDRSQLMLEDCRIYAPQAGTLLRLHTRAGERISSAGLADLAGTDHMVAVAEVYQDDVRRLRVGQPCQLTSPALGSPLQGRVARLDPQVRRQNIFSEQAGEQFDQRVVEVRVNLDPTSNLRASAWTHLQLQAVFEDTPQ